MKALVLLAACLLLVLLAQAEPLLGRADQADAEMQGKEQSHVTVTSFPVEESLSLQDAGPREGLICRCRATRCFFRERLLGVCRYGNRVFRFCCR